MAKKFHTFSCEECASRKSSLFSELCQDHLEQISHSKHCVQYKKGQTLYFEGTRPLGIYCINSGNIKISRTGSDGKEQITHLAKSGEFLGYQALLGGESYSSSATVLEDSVICFIPKEDFLEVLNEDSSLYKRLMSAVCKQLGILEEKLARLSLLSVRERLAATLLMLKESYDIEGEQSNVINIALSREDLANLVGTATETLIRLLSEFKNDGFIELDGKKIRVIDSKGLARTADFYG